MYQPFILGMQPITLLVIHLMRPSSSTMTQLDWKTMTFVPAALLGAWFGWRIFKRLSDRQFEVAVVGADPVQLGLVASLNRPGGNLTGFNQLSAELGPKALELFSELMPKLHTIGLLVNPNNPTFSNLAIKDISAAAAALGKKVQVIKATTDREIDAAFETLGQARVDALLVANDVFFNTQIEQIVALATLHALPVMYSSREFVAAGGS